MSRLTLITTRTSHFARKVHIVLAELGLDFDLRIVTDLLAPDPMIFAGNPLMQVPVLIDGDEWHADSDLIAQHVVRTRDPQDRLGVLSPIPARARQLAVINGIMANEAILLLTGGAANCAAPRYFEKLGESIRQALVWLDGQVDLDRPSFDYLDIATLCMWQHHVHFALVRETYNFPRIMQRVERFAHRPSVTSGYLA